MVEHFYSPHFLYFYKNLICEKHNLLLMEKVNRTIYDQVYDNDIFSIIKYNNFEPYLKNIISQIIISIFTLHQYTNCYHNDTHLDNIFVIEYSNTVTTFLKYNFNNTDYELELSKYLVVLGDYGLIDKMIDSSFIYNKTSYFVTIIYEYIFPLENFLAMPFILSETNKNFMIDIFKILLKYNKNIKSYLESNSNSLRIDKCNYIKNEENNMINEMISNNLILDKIIIQHTNYYNNLPYYLNNEEHISKINLIQDNKNVNNIKDYINNDFESLQSDEKYIYNFVKNNNINI